MYKIIQDDARNWLRKQKKGSVPNIVTGICDLDEIKHTFKSENTEMQEYLNFFKGITRQIFRKLNPDGYAIFIQTDRKYNRQTIDKSYILTDLAKKHGYRLIWHKIVLHQDVNTTDLFRPTYAHMLCYSKNGRPGAAFPDVLPVSKKFYKNATPIGAIEAAIKYIKRYNKLDSTIVDPFVGQGTTCIVAIENGIDCIGIDIDPKQVEITRKLLAKMKVN